MSHVLIDRSAWTKERREMHEKFEEDSGGESGALKQLFSSRKGTLAVLGFIEAKRVGQSAQRQEQEKRWKERERDKAWGLKANRLKVDEEEEAEEGRDESETGGND